MGGSGSLWVASTAVCLVPGVASHRTGCVPGRLCLKHLLEGRWESTEKGPFAKGRGSHPLARAWLRSEPLLLGGCEGPRKEAEQGAG